MYKNIIADLFLYLQLFYCYLYLNIYTTKSNLCSNKFYKHTNQNMSTTISKSKHFIYLILITFFCFSYNSCSNNQAPHKADLNPNIIGIVNGEELSKEQLIPLIDELRGQPLIDEEIQKYAWEQLISETLIAQLSKDAELEVSLTEMDELFLGENISPIVRQEFMNPQTGQIPYDQIRQYLMIMQESDFSMYDPEQQEQLEEQKGAWKRLEEKVKKDRLASKLFTLYQQGVHLPNWMIKSEIERNNTSFNFQYVYIPYTDIPNDAVAVSQQDMQQYIQEHDKRYQAAPAVSIEYVRFPVKPSAADTASKLSRMTGLAKDFAAATTVAHDSLFILKTEGTIDPNFYTKDDLEEPLAIKNALFDAKIGDVVGPYINNLSEYKVVKVLERIRLPDAVRSRQILRIIESNTQREVQEEFMFLDSLRKAILAKEISFAQAAQQFSQDASSENGGDLGFQTKNGAFVKEFENYLFSGKEKGNLGIVMTQFGLHLVEITDLKFVKNTKAVRLAYFSYPFAASPQTIEATQLLANNFAKENTDLASFQAAALQNNLPVQKAFGLELHGYEILGLTKSSGCSKIIEWAHTAAKEGEVSKEIYAIEESEFSDIEEFVVPALVYKNKDGKPNLNDPITYAEVKRMVLHQKKLELVQKEIGKSPSLATVATKYSTLLETTVQPVLYNKPILNYSDGMREPKVLGVAAILQEGQQSKPILGNKGVYIIQLIDKTAPEFLNTAVHRQQLQQKISSTVTNYLFEGFKESAVIEDYRLTNRSSTKSPSEISEEDSPPQETTVDLMYQAQFLFEQGSFELALAGQDILGFDDNFEGFFSVSQDHAETASANLANYYAGICQLNLGGFAQALDFLSAYKAKDPNLKAMTLHLMGDAYAELNDFDKALAHYEKAINLVENKAIASYFLYKTALLTEFQLKDLKKAKSYYQKIIKEYPEFAERLAVENGLIRVTGKY